VEIYCIIFFCYKFCRKIYKFVFCFVKLFIKHCLYKGNLMRAINVGLVVGTILGIINHYDMFVSGEFVRG
jgi:hypothetical protein